MDPWNRFEDALESTGDQEAELRGVLEDLDKSPRGDLADRAELVAAVTAELARFGEVPIDDAALVADQAASLGRSGWPNLHLAQAALASSLPELARDRLSRIPDGFFDERDLHWRSVQCLELEARAQVAIGNLKEAEEAIRLLNSEYVGEPDDEFLESPNELVKILLLPPASRRLLTVLLKDLVISNWLAPDVMAEVGSLETWSRGSGLVT